MGSTDLLKLFKSVHQPLHIKEYAGKTVAVDGRVLLHHDSTSLVSLDHDNDTTTKDNDDNEQNNNDDDKIENPNDEPSTKTTTTKKHSLLDILRSNNVTPLVIVEGKRLPCDQKKTKGDDDKHNDDKEQNNENDKKKTNDDNNNDDMDVLLKQLKKENIDYIQAPYESKAQIAYWIETKRVAASILDEHDPEILAFGCQETILGDIDQDGNTTHLLYSDLATTQEIELRDWSSKSIQELCCLLVMCNHDCANPISLEHVHSLFVKHKKNSRLVLQELVENKKEVEKIHRRMSSRWSQKVFDDTLKQNVPWHKDPALKTKNTIKSSTSDQKTVKTLRLHQDNKENIPPWMNRTIQEATIQPVHRDNPEPPQQAPKVVEQQTKIVPLGKKDNQRMGLKDGSSANKKNASRWSKTTTTTTTIHTTTSSPCIIKPTTTPITTTPPVSSTRMTTTPYPRPHISDKKRKSLDGVHDNENTVVDDENSPMSHEKNTNLSNKKRGSQSLPSRRRLGLSDSSNRRTLF
ncbi:hypothetical protein BDA99DRAFT_525877 [Phascolomyces articulosus]|uniref:Exonuclease 1 n=1 Tax=Phascolomyces articulosus TaxID=60185 RepID=A0AAD5JNI5_9FUNG|nr:hypothetical protein BDA99DRAFT_525877 [Phascolomyces articulosus]